MKRSGDKREKEKKRFKGEKTRWIIFTTLSRLLIIFAVTIICRVLLQKVQNSKLFPGVLKRKHYFHILNDK